MRTLLWISLLLVWVGSAYSGPTDDEFEPNETCAEATRNAVVVGYDLSLYMVDGNEDWFEYESPEGGLIIFQTAKGFSLPYFADTFIEVYDEACEELIAFNDDIDFSGGDFYSAVQLNLPQNSRVYIRIGSGDPEQAPGNYRLECYYGVVAAEVGPWGRVKAMYR